MTSTGPDVGDDLTATRPRKRGRRGKRGRGAVGTPMHVDEALSCTGPEAASVAASVAAGTPSDQPDVFVDPPRPAVPRVPRSASRDMLAYIAEHGYDDTTLDGLVSAA